MDISDANGPTDAALVQTWAAGDERGYEQIVTRYAPLVFGRCRRALGAVDADDATQAVFLVLAKKRDQAAASPVLAAWLLTVADFVIRNAQRDRQRRRRAEHALPPPPPATDSHAMDDIQESLKEHLDASLAELPAAERDAVTLHHLAGHSLAEVAQATGAGLSTVKDRLKRGLERLRRGLALRGVSLSLAALVACLSAEAQASEPSAALLARLRDPSTAGAGPGATPGPSPRAVRWSQTSPSIMSRIALTGSALLLIGGAVTATVLTAESGGTPPAPKPAPKPAPVVAAADPDDLDPDHARQWIIARWNDGGRTVARLKKLPEFALLPPEGVEALDRMAEIAAAGVVFDCNALMSEDDRRETYRMQREFRNMTAEQVSTHVKGEMLRIREANASSTAAGPGKEPEDIDGYGPKLLDGLHAWIQGSSADAQALAQARAFFAKATPKEQAALTVTQEGARLRLGTQGDAAVQAMLDRAATPRHPEADLELGLVFEPGLPGTGPKDTGALTMTVTPEGLRMSASGPWSTDSLRTHAASAPRLDLTRFAALPAEALLAGGIALRPGEFTQLIDVISLAEGVQPPRHWSEERNTQATGRLALIEAISIAIDQVDGAVIAWVEPGAPMPSMTVEADLPRPAYDDLAKAIATASGSTVGPDGALTIAAGMVMCEIGWKDGRLTVTTKPGGIAAIDRTGGFAAQPEIVRAMAAVPDKKPSMCALMRPAALTAYAAPYVGMFAPDWAPRLAEYQRQLTAQQSYGFCTMTSDATGIRLEAAGAMSLIAGAIIGAQGASMAGIKGVN
jgi:RNA polymerase sigma factor (sigma-70 family)